MKPVYQMTLGVSARHEVGLVFPSEIESDVMQSPIFALPIPNFVKDDPIKLVHYLKEEKFYFPGILKNELVNAISEADNSPLILNFQVPERNISLAFELGIHRRGLLGWLRKSQYDMPILLPYVGRTARQSMSDKELYAPLIPINVVELDDIYREKKFAFVGLTPKFGEPTEAFQYS